MSHPHEPPPYRYGPQQQSEPEPLAGADPTGPVEAQQPGTHPEPGTQPDLGTPPGPGTPPEPGTPPPAGAYPQPAGYPAHPQIPAQAGGQAMYGYPPGWQPYGTPEGPTNQFAVASLALGILTPVLFIPGVLSIIFGIVALTQIQERRQKGRGLAIGGMVATGVWVVLLTLLVIVVVITNAGSIPDPAEADGDHTPVHLIEVGHCVQTLPDGDEVFDMTTVDCAFPHEAQVYALFDLTDGRWPGERFVVNESYEGCSERLEQDLPGAYNDPDVDIFYLFPTEESWAFGDREVICMAQFLDGTRTGSLFD